MQTNTQESLPRTIPELLENHTIQVQPQGYSMYPLFVPGRDSAVIEKADCDRLKKGDVILYRRENGILVLHRICRITKDGFYTVGDNQTAVEGPLTASQISGKLIHIIRNGHSFSVNHPVYRILSGFWLFLRPVRRPICLLTAKLKSIVNIFLIRYQKKVRPFQVFYFCYNTKHNKHTVIYLTKSLLQFPLKKSLRRFLFFAFFKIISFYSL